jgi:hypothetical protein
MTEFCIKEILYEQVLKLNKKTGIKRNHLRYVIKKHDGFPIIDLAVC